MQRYTPVSAALRGVYIEEYSNINIHRRYIEDTVSTNRKNCSSLESDFILLIIIGG